MPTGTTESPTLRRGLGLAAVVLALLVAGCSVDGGLGNGLGGLISETEEVELGAKEHPKIVAAFGGVYTNPVLQPGLEKIVNRLSRASKRPDIAYRATVLNSPSVNAFALPGGYLYVTRGLLALANDADELAAVLAHEMGHVSARHAAKRQSEALRAVFVGRIADVLRDPTSIGQALRDSNSMIASFSRNQELEADEIGVETAVRAGFDPFAAVSFLEAMGRDSDARARALGREGDSRHPNLESSHPSTPERIRRVDDLAGNFGFAPGTRAREQSAYLAMIDGMLYGDDPAEGYVRGRAFLHPGQMFTFSVPEDFSLQNSHEAVFAVGGNDAALRFDTVAVPPGQSLEDYVASVWARGTQTGNLRSESINGVPAARGEASHEGWQYRMAAVRLAPQRVYRFLFAARQIDAEGERQFDRIVDSLRTLSEREVAALKPLKLRVVTVRAGDSVRTLAARMSDGDEREERFRLINGLAPGQQVRAGQKVKLVAE
jgi:predicted Zn-dependent protease